MANALYGQGRQHFLAGDLDWDANTIRAGLADAGERLPHRPDGSVSAVPDATLARSAGGYILEA